MSRLVVQIGAWLVALLVPLFFDPFSASNVDLQKTALFLVIVLGMLASRVGLQVASSLWPQGPDSLSDRRTISGKLSDLFRANPLAAPALAYVVIYLIATLSSVDPRISWLGAGNGHGTVTTISIVIFFLLTADAVRTWAEVDRLVTGLLLGSVPVVVYGLVQYFGLDPLLWYRAAASPVQSTLGLSIFCGAYLVLVMPFTLARAVGCAISSANRRRAYVVLFALQFLCLILTLARGVVLGWAVGCATFCGLMTDRWRRMSRAALLLAVIVIGMLLFVFVSRWGVLLLPNFWMGLADLERNRAISDANRMVLWGALINLLPGALPLGYGPETFGIVYESRGHAPLYNEAFSIVLREPHNIFLYQLLSAGIGGLLAFLWLLVAFCRIALSALRRTPDYARRALIAALIASATGYLVQAQTSADAITSLCLLWLDFALGVAVYRLATKEAGPTADRTSLSSTGRLRLLP